MAKSQPVGYQLGYVVIAGVRLCNHAGGLALHDIAPALSLVAAVRD